MTVPGEELVEVLDDGGRVERIVTRAEMRRSRLRHRAVFIAVLDGHGRILVHQRAATKDLWPSRWDVAAGGVAGVGEADSDAARRELAEELGIVSVELRELGRGTFRDDDVDVVGVAFACEHDGNVDFADGEVVDAAWLPLDALARFVEDRECCPDSVAIVVPLLTFPA